MKLSRFFGLMLLVMVAGMIFSGVLQAAGMIKARGSADKQRVRVGETVNFDGSASVPGVNTEIIGWYWDFNDMDEVAVNIVGEKVSHIFNRSGAYSVSLVVENEIGERDMLEIPVEVLPDVDSGLSLTDYFQGGKTGVILDDKHTFCFRLEWGLQFDFRIDNAAGKEISIKIYGYGPNRHVPPSVTPYVEDTSFNEKWQAMYCESYSAPDWKPLENAVYKYNPEDESMVITFTPAGDAVYVAWAPPYTQRYVDALIERWEDNPHFFSSTIGTSAEGRPIEMLTVSDPDVDDSSKKTIWVTAIQHGYEMAGGPACEGMINALLADTDDANRIRKEFVYHLVPLVNVDAVNHGGFRYNMRDVDLNRNWDNVKKDAYDSEISEPEVAAVQRAVRDWVYYDQGSLDMFIDMHCLPPTADTLLVIYSANDSIPAQVKENQTVFINDYLARDYYWRKNDHDFVSSASGSTADRYAGETNVISMTIEHPLGYINVNGVGLVRNTPERLRELGGYYVRQIDRFFNRDKSAGQEKKDE